MTDTTSAAGTPESTAAAFPVTTAFELPGAMVDFHGVLYFGANDGKGGELWHSDGTVAGTRPVVDLEPGVPRAAPRVVAGLAGRRGLILLAHTPGRGFELWSSDGTAR